MTARTGNGRPRTGVKMNDVGKKVTVRLDTAPVIQRLEPMR
jgi:hypothetical protein